MVHIWLSPTRLIDLTGYGISLIACGIRVSQCQAKDATGRLFAILALLQIGFLLDMALDWRWKLHALGMRAAVTFGIYDLRRLPQLLALAVLVTCVVFCSILILSRVRRRSGAGLALIGAMLSVGLWCAEVLSFHGLDQVLYYTIRGVMLIGFIWIGLALVTCLGVWIDSRSHPIG